MLSITAPAFQSTARSTAPPKAISVIRVILRNIQRSGPQSARRLPQDPDTRCACGIHHLHPRPNQSRLPQVPSTSFTRMLTLTEGPQAAGRSRPFFPRWARKTNTSPSPKAPLRQHPRQHHLLAPLDSRGSRPACSSPPNSPPAPTPPGVGPHPPEGPTTLRPVDELEKQTAAPAASQRSSLSRSYNRFTRFRYVHL